MSIEKTSSVEIVTAALLDEGPVKKQRRARGTGSVRFDAKRKLHIATAPREGGRSPKTFYGKTQKEALDKLAAWQRDIAAGIIDDGAEVEVITDLGRNPTLGEWLTYWLANEVKPTYDEQGNRLGGKQPTTYQTYAWVVAKHLLPRAISKVKLDKLTVNHVEAWWKQLAAAGVKMPSAYKSLTVLQGALKRAIVRRDVTALKMNPAIVFAADDVVRKPTARKKLAPEPGQVQALYAAARGERLELVVHLGVRLGLRRQEIAGLRFGDFDFERNVLWIRRRVNRIKGEGVMMRGGVKMADESKEAPVPLANPERWKQLLAAHKAQLEAFALVNKKAWAVDWAATSAWGYLFPTKLGGPMDPNEIFRWFKDTVAAAGMPQVTVHDMRHWCASIAISNGMTLWEVSQLMRHASTNVTESVYGHIMGHAERQLYSTVDDAVDAMLEGPAAGAAAV